MAPVALIGVDIVFLKPKFIAGGTMEGTVTVTPTKVINRKSKHAENKVRGYL